MNVIERINEEVSLYDLFDIADPPVRYKTDKKPCQISCPFHGQDTHPSARVYPDTNSFRCFYCSKSWSPTTFWAEANNWWRDDDKLDIGRAINDLCDRYNISDQTFDWQRKFYHLKKESEEEPEVELGERLSLADYYSWTVAKLVHGLAKDERESLKHAVVTTWQHFDSITLTEESWEKDLKNWYEDAKLMVNGG